MAGVSHVEDSSRREGELGYGGSLDCLHDFPVNYKSSKITCIKKMGGQPRRHSEGVGVLIFALWRDANAEGPRGLWPTGSRCVWKG